MSQTRPVIDVAALPVPFAFGSLTVADAAEFAEPFSLMRGAGYAVLYGASSAMLSFFTAFVVDVYGFPSVFVLAFFQALCGVVVLLVLRVAGVVSFQPWLLPAAAKAAPYSALYLLNLLFGLAGISQGRSATFDVFRRLTVLLVLVLESAVLDMRAPKAVRNSVIGLVVGRLMSGWPVVATNDAVTMGLVLGADVCLALYLVLVFRWYRASLAGALAGVNGARGRLGGAGPVGGHGGSGGAFRPFDIVELLWYNNLLSLPLIFLFGVGSGEFQALSAYHYAHDIGFLAFFLFASAGALVLHYAMIACTTYNSPVTTCVTGTVKDVGSTILRMLVFGDMLTGVNGVMTISGVAIAVLSTVGFCHAKLKQLSAEPSL